MTGPDTASHGLREMRDVVVPGLAVYEQRVDQPRAIVVCVHGTLDRGRSFSRIARRLSRVDVVTYDRRGYQGSRSLGPLGLDEHVADLGALIAHESATTPIIVFGHSFGGVVAMALAATHPQACSGVVVYESPLHWVLGIRSTPPAVAVDPAREAEKFFCRVISPSAWERLTESERQSRRLDGLALVDDLATAQGSTPFCVSTISVPLIYGYGDGRHERGYDTLIARLKTDVPALRTAQLHHAGHGAHLANPDQLAALIMSEVDEVTRAGT